MPAVGTMIPEGKERKEAKGLQSRILGHDPFGRNIRRCANGRDVAAQERGESEWYQQLGGWDLALIGDAAHRRQNDSNSADPILTMKADMMPTVSMMNIGNRATGNCTIVQNLTAAPPILPQLPNA